MNCSPDRPLLSICIPTCCRAEQLDKTLASAIREIRSLNDGSVEVVVSVNFSGDNSAEIARNYAEKYPDIIHVIQQPQLLDAHWNFYAAMQGAHGKFLKLHNDTLLWNPGSLARYMEKLRSLSDETALFLTINGGNNAHGADQPPAVLCRNLDAVTANGSYFLTWIGGFCVRASAFYELKDPFRAWRLNLPQLDMIVRIVNSGKCALVDHFVYFYNIDIKKRAGYDVARVFCRNYFRLLQRNGHLSFEVLKKEKKRLLHEYLLPRCFDYFHEYNAVPQRNFWRSTKIYHGDVYFYASFFKVIFWRCAAWIVPERAFWKKLKNFLKRI